MKKLNMSIAFDGEGVYEILTESFTDKVLNIHLSLLTPQILTHLMPNKLNNAIMYVEVK